MKIPILETLVQEVEDNNSVEAKAIENLIILLLYLSNHQDSVFSAAVLWDLCDDESLFKLVVENYKRRYGRPPLVLSSQDNKPVWVCYFDTLSLKEIITNMLNNFGREG